MSIMVVTLFPKILDMKSLSAEDAYSAEKEYIFVLSIADRRYRCVAIFMLNECLRNTLCHLLIRGAFNTSFYSVLPSKSGLLPTSIHFNTELM